MAILSGYITASLSSSFHGTLTEDNSLVESMQAEGAATAAILLCLGLKREKQLWAELYPEFGRAGRSSIFLELLIPHILSNRLTSLAPDVMQVNAPLMSPLSSQQDFARGLRRTFLSVITGWCPFCRQDLKVPSSHLWKAPLCIITCLDVCTGVQPACNLAASPSGATCSFGVSLRECFSVGDLRLTYFLSAM